MSNIILIFHMMNFLYVWLWFWVVTWAYDHSVLFVSTLRLILRSRTGPQVFLLADTVELVQVDGPSARGEEDALSLHADGVAATKLGTHHVSVLEVPLLVAHCAPSPILPQFHPSGASVWSSSQLHSLAAWAHYQASTHLLMMKGGHRLGKTLLTYSNLTIWGKH